MIDDNYFNLRKVNFDFYQNYKLPFWILNELKDKNSRILDYGCGFGQNLISLKEIGFSNLYGVDISKEALAYCLKKHLMVKQIVNNSLNPFKTKFDYIILTHIIEHLPKEKIITILSDLKKNFLNKNGKLLIAVPNANSNTGSYWRYEDWTHTTIFTTGSLYYVLKKAGYKNIEFIDLNNTLGKPWFLKIIRLFFLTIYKINKKFWNKITASAYHQPSPITYGFEIKVKAN